MMMFIYGFLTAAFLLYRLIVRNNETETHYKLNQ